MRVASTGSTFRKNNFGTAKPDTLPPVSSVSSFVTETSGSLQEMAMASLRTGHAPFALATASVAACLLSADAALASQGPGGGLGTASSFTQLAMAILVWGISALVVGTGLIGIARRRLH